MMAWTTFAALTGPTLPELDGNFGTLSNLVPIPCTVAGTNSLVLTSIASAATIAAYQNLMQFTGIAAATNSGAVTAQVGSLAALNVYKDTFTGPQVLAGGEIVNNCQFTLVYDPALNSNAGGFHLQTGPANLLIGQAGSLSGLTVAGLITTASLSVTGLASVGTLGVANVTSYGTLAIAGLASVGTLQIGSGDQVVRLNSTLATVSFAAIVPQASQQATVSFVGVSVTDNILLGSTLIPASLNMSSYVPAGGSVILRASNYLTAGGATVAAFTATFRITDIGFLT